MGIEERLFDDSLSIVFLGIDAGQYRDAAAALSALIAVRKNILLIVDDKATLKSVQAALEAKMVSSHSVSSARAARDVGNQHNAVIVTRDFAFDLGDRHFDTLLVFASTSDRGEAKGWLRLLVPYSEATGRPQVIRVYEARWTADPSYTGSDAMSGLLTVSKHFDIFQLSNLDLSVLTRLRVTERRTAITTGGAKYRMNGTSKRIAGAVRLT